MQFFEKLEILKNHVYFFKKSLFYKGKPMKKSDFLKKKHDFSIFLIFEKCHRFFFIEKKSFRQNFTFFHVLSYLMPNPCKWHRATPPVPPINAANASPKIRKIMFLVIFLMIFQSKMTQMTCLSGHIWL